MTPRMLSDMSFGDTASLLSYGSDQSYQIRSFLRQLESPDSTVRGRFSPDDIADTSTMSRSLLSVSRDPVKKRSRSSGSQTPAKTPVKKQVFAVLFLLHVFFKFLRNILLTIELKSTATTNLFCGTIGGSTLN